MFRLRSELGSSRRALPYAIAKIGQSAARELFLTGARFSAARAREIGLVHAIGDEAELDKIVAKYVNDLTTSAPGAVAAAKQLIAEVATRTRTSAVEYTIDAIAERRVSPEGQDGMTAFLAKRPPSLDWVMPIRRLLIANRGEIAPDHPGVPRNGGSRRSPSIRTRRRRAPRPRSRHGGRLGPAPASESY